MSVEDCRPCLRACSRRELVALLAGTLVLATVTQPALAQLPAYQGAVPGPLRAPQLGIPHGSPPAQPPPATGPNQPPNGPYVPVAAATYSADVEAQLEQLRAMYAQQKAQTDALAQQLDELARSHAVAADTIGGEGHIVGSDLSLKASWHHGLEVESASKDFRVHVGGRTQFDSVWFASSDAFAGTGGAGDADGVTFRRARLRIDGTMYDVHEWAVEYDLANSVNDNVGLQPASDTLGNVINVPAATDLWWTVKELPLVGNLRIGNFKEPIGLEHLTSSRWLDFLERSFNQDAFYGAFNNGFTPGIMIFRTMRDESMTFATGLFKNNSNVFEFGIGDGEGAWTSRLTWTPWYDEPSEGRYLLHLGASGSLRDPDDGRVRFRTRGSLRNGPGALNPVFADTGFIAADHVSMVGGEAALVYGPLLIQSEYTAGLVDDATVGGANHGTYLAQGFYVEALLYLTGEHRVYDRKIGAFTRHFVHEGAYLVKTDRGPCCGRGAWQVGVRYAQLDLRDSGIDGGVVQDVTAGLNWFWNPNMKVQFNYVFTYRDAPGGTVQGDIHGFGMRVAHDF